MAARFVRAIVALAAVAAGSACDFSVGRTAPVRIVLNQQINTIDVTGLPPDLLAGFAAKAQEESFAPEEWQALMRVSVRPREAGGASPPPVVGRYAVVDGVLRFTPMFPFDEGRDYDVVVDGRVISPGSSAAVFTAIVARPGAARVPSTVVSEIYPSGGVVPANQLRLYLHFSAPMDWRSGHEHVALLDDAGQEVPDAFLPLDADFWNDDRTRYTVFFDPGRVKRGILPNKQMGRALEAGKRYTLLVRREWRDGHGLPLKEEFRHQFTAGPAIERALTMKAWTVTAPAAGTREPLAVTFDAPLDRGLLMRALGVERGGAGIPGEIAIDRNETRWMLTPREPWAAGEYELVALEFLEDLAGNRVGRPFEVDNFERTDITAEPTRSSLPFRIAARQGQ
jgi:hypothetical protein